MSLDQALTRREALAALAALASTLGTPLAGVGVAVSAGGCSRRTKVMFERVDAVGAVGDAVLASASRPLTIDALTDELFDGRALLRPGREVEAQRRLGELHLADREARRFITVDGWELTETEAKAYALVALLLPVGAFAP